MSLSTRAFGLRRSQVIRVKPTLPDFAISGCNPTAARLIRAALCYDALGRLRLDPNSWIAHSGVQVRILQVAPQPA